jgi:hypothetical protein
MNNSSPTARGIRLVLSAFRNNGWRDEASAAIAVVEAAFNGNLSIFTDQAVLAAVLPDQFLLVNGITAEDAREALEAVLDPLTRLATEARSTNPPIILQIGDIDSFSRVKNVAATEVENFANPLDLPEDDVEKIIAKVIGEVYLVKDWPGEADDMFSAQVVLYGRQVRASFLLKGNGLKGPLKPKNLGKNGDQITRMTGQPAELFVVQHVGRVEPSVRRQLNDAVTARRYEGNTAAVGTVWDGIDTARLGVAYGFLDPVTGALKPNVIRQRP